MTACSHLTCGLFLVCCCRRPASRAILSRLSLSVDCWKSWPARPRWSDLENEGTRVKKKEEKKRITQPCFDCVRAALTRLRHGVGDVGCCRAVTRPGRTGGCSAGGVLRTTTVYLPHMNNRGGPPETVTNEPKLHKIKRRRSGTYHWPPCWHGGLFGKQRLQSRAQYAHTLQLGFN